jgi:heme A synthase
MAYFSGDSRFRGTKKQLGRLRLTTADRWLAALIVLICLLAIAAGAWLGFHYSD